MVIIENERGMIAGTLALHGSSNYICDAIKYAVSDLSVKEAKELKGVYLSWPYHIGNNGNLNIFKQEDEREDEMPAKSKRQRRYMGYLLGLLRKGKKLPNNITLSEKQLRDFAGTPDKQLPEKLQSRLKRRSTFYKKESGK
jgi:hypothetical protein